MNKQNVALALAAALGVALACAPAFAQSSGTRGPNDGGLVTQGDYYPPQQNAATTPTARHRRSIYNSAGNQQSNTPAHVGRNVDDNGSVQ